MVCFRKIKQLEQSRAALQVVLEMVFKRVLYVVNKNPSKNQHTALDVALEPYSR